MDNIKICGGCKESFPETVEYFSTKKLRTKTVFQWQCRKCQKEYRKNHYLKNKDKYIEKSEIYQHKVADWFDDLKKNLKCEKCGEDRWWVLDFHHKDSKEKDNNVSNLKWKGSKKGIIKEIEKCSVLCSNCHRDFHHNEKIKSI